MLQNINLNTIISHSDGFGINTNLFETNILNLTVVIGVLFYYGKTLIMTRK